jgi:hypothetical protein
MGSIALNLVGVYRALGGGWEIRAGHQPYLAALDHDLQSPGRRFR